MGLLDALFNSDNYGGQGGGLLDLIRGSSTRPDPRGYDQPFSMGTFGDMPSNFLQRLIAPTPPPDQPAGDSFDQRFQPALDKPFATGISFGERFQPGNNPPAAPPSFADRFNAMPNAPPIFAPGGRSFDNAQFDPQTYAPNQAQPIAVGNYQMPRMGAAPLFAPQDQAALPPNAQPTQGQLPPQQMAPQQQQELPPAFGGSSYLERLNAGGGLIGSLLGDTSQQKNLTAQYHAIRQRLIANGESEKDAASGAMIAVMNPEAAKTILPQLFTNKQDYGVINEDPLSGKQYGFIDKIAHTINGKPVGQGGAPEGQSSGLQGMTDRITSMRSQGATKEQMLAQIPTGYRDDVASLIDGKSVPANLGRSQLRGPLLTLAKVIDPTFDETLIPARVQMRKDFAGEGKNGQAIGALNTVQHHAGQLSDAIEEFQKAGGGSNWPIINAGKLMLANNTSYDPKLRDAAQKLSDKLNATEHEVASAYNAGHITDADRKTWNDIKASNLPADQLRQKLADFDELLAGKRDSLNHMYQTMFHTDAPTIDRKANEETSAKIHSRLPGASMPAQSGLPAGWSVKVNH